MNKRALARLLGKDDYRVLVEIFDGKRLEELTVNRILDLYRSLIDVGLLKDTTYIEAVRGKPIKVILRRDSFQDVYDTIYNDEPEKPATRYNIISAAELLGNVGITPMGA